MNDKENAIECLNKAAEAAECYDKTMDSENNYYPIFVRNTKCCHEERFYLDTVRLLQLMDKRTAFDVIRETDEFKQIHAHLETLSPKE